MESFRNISLKNKLTLIQISTAIIAVLMCCGIFVYNDIATFKKSSVNTKYSLAEIVGENSIAPLEFNDKVAANEILLHFNSIPSVLNAALLDKTGKVFARYDKRGEENFSFPIPSGKSLIVDKSSYKIFIVSYRIFQEKDLIGTVMLRAEISDYDAIVYDYIKIAIIILLISVLLAFLISNSFQRIVTKPLLSLVSKIKEVTETGNYSVRSTLNGEDEIGILSKGFNSMLSQIEKAENNLKDINLGLEKRVKERTLELEALNKDLLAKSEELKASNEELEQFAYVASHDLQEPLRSISNFVGLLEESYSGKKDESTELFFKFITTATVKMQNLIKDLLDYSRVGRNISFTPVDCNEILKDTLSGLDSSIKESQATISSDILPVLSGNETELKRLFQNLISNALKFRKKDVAPEISISCEEKDTEYLFAIKDNGIGIEEKYIPKLFVIFQRLHSAEEYPGTGIGLTSCKKIVTLHKGKIWIKSKPGEGTTFYFTIRKNL
jgi:signal transduction histidine kinase